MMTFEQMLIIIVVGASVFACLDYFLRWHK